MRENAERQLASGTPAQELFARQLLDGYDAVDREEAETRAQAIQSMPTAKRIAEAFRKRPPTPTEGTVIRALLDNPQATSGALTRARGWDGRTWQMHFGGIPGGAERGASSP